jgi:hypothetical protein
MSENPPVTEGGGGTALGPDWNLLPVTENESHSMLHFEEIVCSPFHVQPQYPTILGNSAWRVISVLCQGL